MKNVEIKIVGEEACLRAKNSDVRRLWVDNTKAKKLFWWQPDYVRRDRFKNGLIEAAAWFVQHDNLRGYRADISIYE